MIEAVNYVLFMEDSTPLLPCGTKLLRAGSHFCECFFFYDSQKRISRENILSKKLYRAGKIILLTCTSFLTIVFIAVDRVLAVFLHLRYQELVTSKRVAIALVSLWLTSVVAVSSSFISLHDQNNMLVVSFEFFGLFLTTVVGIYKVVVISSKSNNKPISTAKESHNEDTPKNEVDHNCFVCLHRFPCLFSSKFVLHINLHADWI